MLVALIACTVLASRHQQPLPANLQGRALTWDPQGLVPFDLEAKLTAMDRSWIDLMVQGEYARASDSASGQCTSGKPSFFAIWTVAESARVRKNWKELSALATKLSKQNPDSPFALYAGFRLLSLKLAQTPSGTIVGKIARANPDYLPLREESERLWKRCRTVAAENLPIAVALAQGKAKVKELHELVEDTWKHSKAKDALLLWKSRALMLGSYSFNVDPKTNMVGRDKEGRLDYYFEEGFEPDMKGALEALEQYHAKFPDDEKYFFYHARWLSWQAFFFTAKASEREILNRRAINEMKRFTTAKDQPAPLVICAEKFLKKPDPGAFFTPPLE